MAGSYNVVDLFAGCGGLSLGIESVSKQFNIVGAIENNEKAFETYKFNFPDVKGVVCRDITKLDPKDYQQNYLGQDKINLIIGGPPCPGFSNIGRSKIMNLVKTGKWNLSEERHAFIDDPRNQLFYEFVKYVDHFKPEIFLFENVKGIGSHKKRDKSGIISDILDIIQEEFIQVGYDVKRKLLNSADFGVPQIRERYFLVGCRNDLNTRFSFPKPTHVSGRDLRKETIDSFLYDKNERTNVQNNKKIQKQITAQQALMDIPVVNYPTDKNHPYRYLINEAISEFEKRYKDYKEYTDTPSLESMKWFLQAVRGENNELVQGHGMKGVVNCHVPRKVNDLGDKEIFPLLKTEPNGVQVKYSDLPQHLKRYGRNKNDPNDKRSEGFQDKMRRIPWWKPSWTIVAHLAVDAYMFVHPDREQDRTITAREAARLQSFPDTFDFSAGGAIARSHQFRMIGNAVPPLLGKAIGKSILKALELMK